MAHQPQTDPKNPAFTNHHWINGQPVAPVEIGSGYQATNPSTGESWGPGFFDATPEHLDSAAQASARDWQWMRQCPISVREQWLRSIASEILNQRDTLVQIANLETGFPNQRLHAEINRICKQAEDFAQWIKSGAGLPERSFDGSAKLELSYQSLGPIAVFGASNFPFACSVFGGDTCSALAMGCPVIFKAHPAHPNTCQAVADCVINALKKMGCPGGVFQLLHGQRPAISRSLVTNPNIAAVAFTGSRQVGASLYQLAANRPVPIPFFGELGSVNPLFIHPETPKVMDGFSKRLASAFMMGCGQFCTNPGIWMALKGAETDTWLKETLAAIQSLPATPLLTSRIRDSYENKIQSLKNRKDLNLIELNLSGNQKKSGFFVKPTLARIKFESFIQEPDIWDEVFGPFTWVVECSSMAQMFEIIGSMPGQLSSAVFGNVNYWRNQPEVLSNLASRVGRLLFNDFPPGLEVSWALHHGGPFPASTHSDTTSIGLDSIRRFVRPVCRQRCD